MSKPAQTVIRRVPASRFSEEDSTIPWIYISTDATSAPMRWNATVIGKAADASTFPI
jgi:hypothetical protein